MFSNPLNTKLDGNQNGFLSPSDNQNESMSFQPPNGDQNGFWLPLDGQNELRTFWPPNHNRNQFQSLLSWFKFRMLTKINCGHLETSLRFKMVIKINFDPLEVCLGSRWQLISISITLKCHDNKSWFFKRFRLTK